MPWRSLARTLVDAYHQIMGEPVDFWPAYEAEVRKAVTAAAPPTADPERDAARQKYRREHPADAPSDQTRPVRCRSAGLQRTVTYIGKVTAPEALAVPAAPVAAAQRVASASRQA